MENSAKIIYVFLLIVLFANCKKSTSYTQEVLSVSNSIQEKCKNDPRLYKSVRGDLLYSDSLNNIYLKRKNQFPVDYPNLSECQKLPYVFLDIMALNNDSIVSITNNIDIKTFSRFKGTDIYFYDKNKTYAYSIGKASYPRFKEISINRKNTQVLDSFKIKDDVRIYNEGFLNDTRNGK